MFLFNTVENRSSEWGTSPWHWYFSTALPKALLPAALVLAGVGAWYERGRAAALVGPSLLFVLCYSALPHKELRFIFHAVPPLNVLAALGEAQKVTRRHLLYTAGPAF